MKRTMIEAASKHGASARCWMSPRSVGDPTEPARVTRQPIVNDAVSALEFFETLPRAWKGYGGHLDTQPEGRSFVHRVVE